MPSEATRMRILITQRQRDLILAQKRRIIFTT